MTNKRDEQGRPELERLEGEGVPSGGRQAPGESAAGSPESEEERATRRAEESAVEPSPRVDEPGPVYPSTTRDIE